MKENSKWVSVEEACNFFRIDKKTLDIFREEGYLKPGIHWKSSSEPNHLPWNPKVIYHLKCCGEFLKSWNYEYPLYIQLEV